MKKHYTNALMKMLTAFFLMFTVVNLNAQRILVSTQSAPPEAYVCQETEPFSFTVTGPTSPNHEVRVVLPKNAKFAQMAGNVTGLTHNYDEAERTLKIKLQDALPTKQERRKIRFTLLVGAETLSAQEQNIILKVKES